MSRISKMEILFLIKPKTVYSIVAIFICPAMFTDNCGGFFSVISDCPYTDCYWCVPAVPLPNTKCTHCIDDLVPNDNGDGCEGKMCFHFSKHTDTDIFVTFSAKNIHSNAATMFESQIRGRTVFLLINWLYPIQLSL